jgi:hypothetical protein
VRLTDEEIALADDAARLRQENADRQRIGDAHGYTGDGLAAHVQGARAEVAVARFLDVEWTAAAVPEFRQVEFDVGHLQVRSTPRPNGRLIVHPGDPDNQPFVLVRSHRDPVFVLVGWVYGEEAKQRAWWTAPASGRPCYLVPNERLRAMAFLPAADDGP